MKNFRSANSKIAISLGLAMLTVALAVNIARSTEPADDAKDSIGEPTEQEKTFSSNLMEATKNEDYKAFMADGDKDFKTITKSMFKSVCGGVSPRLKKGYHLVFLGAAKKGGLHHMTIWKVVYTVGNAEDVLQLDVKNGKVAGALLK